MNCIYCVWPHKMGHDPKCPIARITVLEAERDNLQQYADQQKRDWVLRALSMHDIIDKQRLQLEAAREAWIDAKALIGKAFLSKTDWKDVSAMDNALDKQKDDN